MHCSQNTFGAKKHLCLIPFFACGQAEVSLCIIQMLTCERIFSKIIVPVGLRQGGELFMNIFIRLALMMKFFTVTMASVVLQLFPMMAEI